ncbi:DUF2497 domain-containing protein [Novispirillum itersonii]|uniref:DUF2497 domain-containing protein n=1 Tax=Novispirillum itersonii TaxID=189 RepID=A0A7X0DM18_NOVIT|nr:DUF2497 domain-containing protein [Novispirillum itersonii]MBB6210573.1 hypothetical protein [Novispirillum itersonii]
MDEKNQEPSMEDILASIRKILSEDEEEPAAKAPAPAPKPAPMPEPEPEPEPAWDMTPEPEPEPEPEVSWDDALQAQALGEDDEEDEVFELTDSMVAEEEEEPLLLQPVPAPQPIVEEVEDELESIWRPEPVAAPLAVVDEAERLVSPPTEAKSTAAFSELALIARERSLGVGNGGLTIEGLVREMVRPLLTEWLDNHLPDLVERLVRKEIERLVSGGEK